MTTTDIFRKIYQDLKEEFTKENNNYFFKEYTIPSINYQENSKGVSDLYFTSEIEMEFDRMMNFFENKVFYRSYKDKYIFSNNEEVLKEKLLEKIDKYNDTKESIIIEKLEKELKEFKKELIQKTPEEIIERAYEITVKEEIIGEIKEYELDKIEKRALLKEKNLLEEFYQNWRNVDGRLGEILSSSIIDEIEIITNDYEKKVVKKDRESR